MNMHTLLSCADYAFPLLAHDKVIQLIRLLDIPAIDLGVFEGRSHIKPSEIVLDPEKKGKALMARLDQVGLSVADIFLQTGPEVTIASTNNPDKQIREKNREIFKGILAFNNAINCTHLTGLPGVFHLDSSRDRDWDTACEETTWRVETAKAFGITYAVEPHLESLIETPKETLRFVKEVSGLTLALDCGHFVFQGIPMSEIYPLLPCTSHFHARCGAEGKLQCSVSENTIDFKKVFQQLGDLNYQGYACLEYVYIDWHQCNRNDNVSETILLRDVLRSF